MKSVCGKCKRNPCECEENAAIEKLFAEKDIQSIRRYEKNIGATLAMLASRDILLSTAAKNVQEDLEKIKRESYNSAIHDAAATTNSGMDNYQRIMGLLK